MTLQVVHPVPTAHHLPHPARTRLQGPPIHHACTPDLQSPAGTHIQRIPYTRAPSHDTGLALEETTDRMILYSDMLYTTA